MHPSNKADQFRPLKEVGFAPSIDTCLPDLQNVPIKVGMGVGGNPGFHRWNSILVNKKCTASAYMYRARVTVLLWIRFMFVDLFPCTPKLNKDFWLDRGS